MVDKISKSINTMNDSKYVKVNYHGRIFRLTTS